LLILKTDSAPHCDCQMLSTMRRQIFVFCVQTSLISTILSLAVSTDNRSMSPMGHHGWRSLRVRAFDPSGALNHNVYSQDVVERYTTSSVSCCVDRWSSQLVRCKALLYITDLSRLLCIAIEQIRKVLDQES